MERRYWEVRLLVRGGIVTVFMNIFPWTIVLRWAYRLSLGYLYRSPHVDLSINGLLSSAFSTPPQLLPGCNLNNGTTFICPILRGGRIFRVTTVVPFSYRSRVRKWPSNHPGPPRHARHRGGDEPGRRSRVTGQMLLLLTVFCPEHLNS